MDRETLDVDILIVGAGPAGLACALRLAQLQKQAGGEKLAVAVLEKGREIGAHILSGALLDPVSLQELVPDFKAKSAPLAAEVREDRLYFLTRHGRLHVPIAPPPLQNHGHYIISLSRLVRWLGGLVEAEGIDLFTGFAGQELLYEDGRVAGVRTGDRGLDRQGGRKAGFEPGVEVRAKVTILAEGVRGSLTKALNARVALWKGKQPPLYAIGLKELWSVPPDRLPAGTVIHALGYPFRVEEFGGAFIYAMPEGQLSVGLVAGLDYRDPIFDPHAAFQRVKLHPFVKGLLEGGRLVRYGAKALPEGGWYTIPRCSTGGAIVVGDAAGFMNSIRLKGIHLAMKTGMLAAEAAFDAVRAGDVSAARLAKFEQLVEASFVRRELYPARNVHQSFEHGLLAGTLFSGFSLLTRGWWFQDPMPSRPGHDRMEKIADYYGDPPPPAVPPVRIDRQLTFDRVTGVHFSGTRHEEDQPSHLLVVTDVCHPTCTQEYGNPCERFCPASVYEMVEDGSGRRLQINGSNCVHCKTCDIEDPYQVITWVPPEGGGGPQYDGM